MDFAALERALEGGRYVDYVGRAASFGSPRRIWEHGFDKVAKAAAGLVDEAGRLGVVVAVDAGLDDLGRLFEHCAVVTVVAHWRGAEIDTADIRLPPEAIVDRVEREQ